MAINNGAANWCQTFRACVDQSLSSRDIGVEFLALCQQNNTPLFEALSEISTHWGVDALHRVTDALLDALPNDSSLKVDLLNFYRAVPTAENFIGLIRPAEELLLVMPNEAQLYYYLAFGYKYSGRQEDVVRILKQGRKACARPIDYQCPALPVLPDDISGIAVLDVPEPDEIFALDVRSKTNIAPPLDAPVSVETLNGQEVGKTGAVVSGELGQTCHGGQYAFQYGASPAELDKMTDWQYVPPKCFGEVLDTTLGTFSSWLCYGTVHEFSTEPCSITSKWPFAIDRNHIAGVGQINLLYGWGPSSLPRGTYRSPSRMHAIDLRGGQVSFRVKFKDMDTKGARLALGAASYAVNEQPSAQSEQNWAASQWMMTGETVAQADLSDGDWMDLTFKVDADPSKWSFGSNNHLGEQPNSERYVYLPLSNIVERHSGNFAVCAMFADDSEIPEGKITLRYGRVLYRDWSMLRRENGAELISFPGEDRDAAAKLSNGKYRTQNDGWVGPQRDGPEPHKFVWKLPDDARVDGIALVQHPHAPTKSVRVCLRDGGTEGNVILDQTIEMPNVGFDKPKRALLSIPNATKATHVEITLIQGHDEEQAGLMGVEVFGDFIPQQPALEPVRVCAEIEGLPTASEIYYRLAYRDSSGVTYGETKALQLPTDGAPVLHALTPTDDGKGTFMVHGNAMGAETTIDVRLDGDLIRELPFGTGDFCRHTVITLSAEQYLLGRVLEVQSRNPFGRSEPIQHVLP